MVEGSVYQNDNGEHKAIMRLMANDQGNIKILEEHKDIKVVFKSELNDKETS